MISLHFPRLVPALQAGYAAFYEFLGGSGEGLGEPETAIGAERSDQKRYLEFGSERPYHILPAIWELRQILCEIVHERNDELDAALLPGSHHSLAGLLDRQRGPVLRLTFYPSREVGLVNYPHTDIDLFTILPAATRPGLEFKSQNGWERANVGPSEVLVLPGVFLREFGGLPAVEHRVVTDGDERVSASLFVNADPTLRVEGGERVSDLFEARLAAVRRAQRNEGS